MNIKLFSRKAILKCARLNVLMVIVSFLVLLVPDLIFADEDESTLVFSVKGTVEYRLTKQNEWQLVQKGLKLTSGSEIRTHNGARVGLKFAKGKLLRLRENSYLKISAQSSGNNAGKVGLVTGVMHLFSREGGVSPTVDTRDVSAAIRGTEVIFKVEGDQTKVLVVDGTVALNNNHGTLELNHGEQGEVSLNKAPLKKLLVNPKQEVQWALYYPTLTTLSEFDDYYKNKGASIYNEFLALKNGTINQVPVLPSNDNPHSKAVYALYLALNNQTTKALETLNFVNLNSDQNDLLILKSDFYLLAGETSKALDYLNSVNDDAYAPRINSRRAVISVVKGDLIEAANLIESSKSQGVNYLNWWLAKAYVHQAERDLVAAKEALTVALKLNPKSGYTAARLAELELGFGNLDKAMELSKKATKYSDSSYINTVKGFTELTSGNVNEAISSFNKAVQLDSEDGLPRLGLGLAQIRKGDLNEGKNLLEIASDLEPNRALFRSYLGKLYFESLEEEAAYKEYQRSIDLDPSDPTPYLYRAFNHLSRNRVVDALRDVEASIARNQNRAVYRSDLLLDQDASIRSTSLAEVYQQLGFQRIAQLEAMKSINQDYGNFGAHRLLAQSYDGDFYRNTQFVENTVADLLAPLSLNIFAGLSGYSAGSSLNEYTALFDRDQIRTGISGNLYSANDELNGQIFQTGRINNLGYYGGYRTLYARGSKSNSNFARLHRIDLATQYQVTKDDRVILKTGFTRNDDQTKQLGVEIDDFEVSVGSAHSLGPAFNLLTRLEYFDRQRDGFDQDTARRVQIGLDYDNLIRPFSDDVVRVFEESDVDTRTLTYGMQLSRDYGDVSWILGTDLSNTHADATDQAYVSKHPGGVFQGTSAELYSTSAYHGFNHSSYLYTAWALTDQIELNGGANYAQIELPNYDVIGPFVDGTRKESLLSPKIGLSIYPTDKITLRSAFFRGLGTSSVIAPGGLEPTLVGSFSQVFGDLPGAKSETFAVGLDHKSAGSRYMGVEYLYRDIKRELIDVVSNVNFDLDALREQVSFIPSSNPDNEREHIIRSYAYQVLSSDLASTFDYSYWNLQDASLNSRNVLHRAILGLNYFSENRWFSFIKAAWRDQKLINRVGFDNNDNSWLLVDIGAGYRLPYRHGAVSLVLKNLLDRNFQYEDRGREAPIYSGFNAGVEFSFNF